MVNQFISWLITAMPPPKIEPINLVQSGAREVPPDVVAFIEKFEKMHRVKDGLVYAYHDPIGLPTIGIGHLLSRVKFEDLSKYPPITLDEAHALHRRDLDKFADGVSKLITVDITDNEFGALVSLAFNIGLGALSASTLRRKLNRGDPRSEVGDEFLKWNKSGGAKLAGLTRRRVAERKIFLGLF